MLRNVEDVKKELSFAADVMKRLPNIKIQGYICRWPKIKYTADDLRDQTADDVWVYPSNYEISKMEVILEQLKPLNAMETRLVWKRANRVPWKLLSHEFGMHRSNLSSHYEKALVKISLMV